MADYALKRKDELEVTLRNERDLVRAGKLKEENPLDLSDAFQELCEACRIGDLKVCQEKISEGVNINARDQYDYTPLILVSSPSSILVHQKVYDYSKSVDPLQPFAAHLSSLLVRDHPQTADILIAEDGESFNCHRFILAARSTYFQDQLSSGSQHDYLVLPERLPGPAFRAAIKHLYFGEAPRELRWGPGTGYTEPHIINGIERAADIMKLDGLVDSVKDRSNRRLARQRRTDEVARGREQMETWFRENVLENRITIEVDNANEVKWTKDNNIFADIILRADYTDQEEEAELNESHTANDAPKDQQATQARHCVLYPVHKAMLLRSEFFLAMLCSPFKEAQETDELQIITVDCSPPVLEHVLYYLYAEKADFPLKTAVEILFAADQLMIERLKNKAAVVISALGNGSIRKLQDTYESRGSAETGNGAARDAEEEIDIYDIIRAGWLTRVQRLEEFGSRYLAYRLESHIDLPEFQELVIESAKRIEKRQETDTIELIDDIRYYLNERFRCRFEDTGFKELMDEQKAKKANVADQEMGKEEMPDDEESASAAEDARSVSSDGEDISDTSDNEEEFITIDGQVAKDEFQRDTMDYNILINKLDDLLDKLDLEA
ncbi:G2-specific serine/threonine protein kinase [Ascosphaera pollenicola]|nr:G2-specific serine/threonine protein kinase [Ascosphaera pollenicola]